MQKVIRPLAVFGVASGVSVVALQLSTGAHGAIEGPTARPSLVEAFTGARPGSRGYSLARLQNLDTALYYVVETYVDPARIDYERMYVEALEAVERHVPVCMFRREPGGSLLHLEIGDYRTVLEVQPVASQQDLLRELQRVAKLVELHLDPEDVPTDRLNPPTSAFVEVEHALINGALSTLDPHTLLMPPEQSREMDVENQGQFGGLGITITDRQGRLTIEYPLPDTPAQRAGLQPDDHIVRIDGISTINMGTREAVQRLRGAPQSPVTIEIMRDGLSEPKQITIIREEIRPNQVTGELLDGGIGYVSIKSFHSQTARGLKEVLPRLDREANGLRGLIIDLRDNPGGYLNQAIEVADTFLERGNIVSTVDGTGRKFDRTDARATGQEPSYPLVVLVNASSASASEIVAGALRNNERAVIVGERTFGKGSVQNLHPFSDDAAWGASDGGSKLKLTISKYLTPGERSIQSVGIPADIELVPSVVTRDEEAQDNQILLFHRERVRREADLDKHLEQESFQVEDPAYRLRYLRANDQRRRTFEVDLSSDFQVQFARDLLLSAPNARRAEMLAAAAPVVSRHQRRATHDIAQALGEAGFDWRDGPAVDEAHVEVRFDLGEAGHLRAGEEQRIALEVTNRGEETLYRLAAVGTFDNQYLQPREFVFGRLEPGETRRYEQRIRLPDGYPTELTPVSFSFRDTSGQEVSLERAKLPVEGRPLPRYAWSWQLSDAEPGGNGNGIIEPGETVTIELTVENIGEGPAGEPLAQLKNHSGRAIDLLRGSINPGEMRTAEGEPCPVLEAGVDAGRVVGDPSTGEARIRRGDLPRYAEECTRVLDPGESWTGSFEVLVREPRPDGLHLDLEIMDNSAFDFAAVYRSGFGSYFMNREAIRFNVGDAMVSSERAEPPSVQITRAPGPAVDRDQATISGVVTDNRGLAHVQVFATNEKGSDKVFFQGRVQGSSVRSVPFTADVPLQPGLNTFTVLATDIDGYTHTASAVTFYVAPEMQAQVGDLIRRPAQPLTK